MLHFFQSIIFNLLRLLHNETQEFDLIYTLNNSQNLIQVLDTIYTTLIGVVLIVSAYDIVIKSIGYFRMIELGWYKSIKVIPIMPIDIFYTKRKQTTSGIFKKDQSIVEEMKVITLNLFSPTIQNIVFNPFKENIWFYASNSRLHILIIIYIEKETGQN